MMKFPKRGNKTRESKVKGYNNPSYFIPNIYTMYNWSSCKLILKELSSRGRIKTEIKLRVMKKVYDCILLSWRN